MEIRVGNTGVARRSKDGDMSSCRLLIEVVEACEHLPATGKEESIFGSGPALGNDFANAVIKGKLFQEQELRHTLNTLCLGNRTGHQGNIRAWGNGVCPFDIKSGLRCPAYHRSIVWIERFGAKWSINFKGRGIRDTKGVNDDNCLAFTIITLTEQAIYGIGSTYF